MSTKSAPPKKAIQQKPLKAQPKPAPGPLVPLSARKDHPSKIAAAAPEPKTKNKKPAASAPEIPADQLLRAQGLPLLSTAYLFVRNLSRSADDKRNGTLLGEFGNELYVLERKGDKFEAYPTVSLADNRLHILRRNSSDPVSVTQMVDALLFSGYIKTLDPVLTRSVEFDGLKEAAIESLADSVGCHAFSSYTARNIRGAERSMDDANAVFEKALRAIVHLNGFTPGDPLIWKDYRAIAAIDIGAILCTEHGRLPTKKELRAAMEAKGLAFAKSNALSGKWKDVFKKAGLEDLED